MQWTGRRAVAAMWLLVGFVSMFPGVAAAEFLGDLNGSEPWTLDITPATSVNTGAAVTVFGLTESSVKVIALIRTTPASPGAAMTFGPLGRKIRRISIQVSQPSAESYEIRITQGTSVFVSDAVGDAVVVLDLAP